MAEIMSISNVLKMNLNIPNFQRPYKWQNRNIVELLDDINTAIDESNKYKNFSYRIGTIILYKSSDETYDVIDGQQRLLSLVMIAYYLDNRFDCSLLNKSCMTKESRNNLNRNYICIKDWFTMKSNALKEKFIRAFSNCLEVVVITVDKLPCAFQLFDSQNTRGKELDPHDLLKAYHLREMQKDRYEMFHAVRKWEEFSPESISSLFDIYLFAILNWSKKEKTEKFSAKYIDYYKGIPDTSDYTYAKRARNANPYFQITEPFNSGSDFFEMVSHYLILLDDIEKELSTEKFRNIKRIIDDNSKYNSKNEIQFYSVGFKYAVNLFKCALLCYYDKFHNFDEQAVKKIFTWALMLRVDMENLGFDSINKYASCFNDEEKYTNNIPMFSRIISSRYHTDISNMLIHIKRKPDSAKSQKWNKLYNDLKILNGLEA